MGREEIEELMQLMGLTPTDLASKLRVRESTVYRWLKDGAPDKAESILMRIWLAEERKKSKPVPARQAK